MRRGREGRRQCPLSEHFPCTRQSKAERERKERGTEGEGGLGSGEGKWLLPQVRREAPGAELHCREEAGAVSGTQT